MVYRAKCLKRENNRKQIFAVYFNLKIFLDLFFFLEQMFNVHTSVHIFDLYNLILIELPPRDYDNIYQLKMFLDCVWLYTKLLNKLPIFSCISLIK